jgi:AcrR family transcriptional regulator
MTTAPKVARKSAAAKAPSRVATISMAPTADRRQPAAALGPRANRTIARILDATREVFLTHGYAGTTIDEIAKAAGISRGSFYTYFPTKRDVLLAVGAHSAAEADALVDDLALIEPSLAGMAEWVDRYYDGLESHGAFAFAWTQAARHDEEIRLAGLKGHLRLCEHLGRTLGQLGGQTIDDPVALGLASFSMFERAWDYCHLYGDRVDENAVRASIARSLWSATRPVPTRARTARTDPASRVDADPR